MSIRLSSRYLTNLILFVAGGFLVVASTAFADPVVKWVGFGIGALAFVVGAGMATLIRDPAQRAIGGLVTILAAWTIVASLVFALGTVVALMFASALGFVGLAIIGLTAHELRTERVVHSLEVSTAPATDGGHERIEPREPVAA